jgi:hypothetical protein
VRDPDYWFDYQTGDHVELEWLDARWAAMHRQDNLLAYAKPLTIDKLVAAAQGLPPWISREEMYHHEPYWAELRARARKVAVDYGVPGGVMEIKSVPLPGHIAQKIRRLFKKNRGKS